MVTPARSFCLKALCEGDKTGRDISRAAIPAGLNKKSSGRNEWADGHLKWLRDNKYVEHTGARDQASKVYRLTEKGRAASTGL